MTTDLQATTRPTSGRLTPAVVTIACVLEDGGGAKRGAAGGATRFGTTAVEEPAHCPGESARIPPGILHADVASKLEFSSAQAHQLLQVSSTVMTGSFVSVTQRRIRSHRQVDNELPKGHHRDVKHLPGDIRPSRLIHPLRSPGNDACGNRRQLPTEMTSRSSHATASSSANGKPVTCSTRRFERPDVNGPRDDLAGANAFCDLLPALEGRCDLASLK